MGGCFESYKPALSMIFLQSCYAGVALLTRESFLQGMNVRVFVTYRQAVATLFIAPIAFFSSGREVSKRSKLGLRSFSLIFLAALIGATLNQNLYFEGIDLASSTVASASVNLIPAVTFVLAAFFGLEKVNGKSLRSIAKIVGTIVCVGGAICMALVEGPKVFNAQLGTEDWVLGCAFLFASACCWSTWLILQVAVTESYPDQLTQTAWMCFMSTIQSAIITFIVERDLDVWKFNTVLDIVCILYAGILCSGIAFLVQAWCISKRGPLFSAMFNPLCTVIVTVLAAIFLQETTYLGGLVGAILVIVGLYIVLWGKAEDPNYIPKPPLNDETHIEDEREDRSSTADLEQPLLADK